MTFTAFGRSRDHNGSASDPSSHSNGNGHYHQNGNGNGHSNGNANGSANRYSLRATLSSDVSIKGIVKFTRELVIDGEVEGTIHSGGSLTVGKNGRVRGDIQTRSVTVLGKVDGNLSVGEKCELRSGCTLRGDIETARLVMEENVNFTGNAAIATRDYLSELRMPNGHLNGNGRINGNGNGHSNGDGQLNGNGHKNGCANGHS